MATQIPSSWTGEISSSFSFLEVEGETSFHIQEFFLEMERETWFRIQEFEIDQLEGLGVDGGIIHSLTEIQEATLNF